MKNKIADNIIGSYRDVKLLQRRDFINKRLVGIVKFLDNNEYEAFYDFVDGEQTKFINVFLDHYYVVSFSGPEVLSLSISVQMNIYEYFLNKYCLHTLAHHIIFI